MTEKYYLAVTLGAMLVLSFASWDRGYDKGRLDGLQACVAAPVTK